MGEATYYLIAEFETEEEAELAEMRARVVLDDIVKFENDWQTIRGDSERPVKERHNELLNTHPLVAKFIKLPDIEENDVDIDEKDINMNYLADKCEMNDEYGMHLIGTGIHLSCMVWHIATWDNIEDFFFRLGAEKAGWFSDEYIDPFELLESQLHDSPSTRKFLEETLRSEIDTILVANKLAND